MTDERSAPDDVLDPVPDPGPGDGDDVPTFEAPWQARAFALAVALTDDGDLDWRAFQSRLVDEIDAADAREHQEEDENQDQDENEKRAYNDDDDPEETYYRQWLAALERVLVDRGLLDPGEFADRVAEFEAGDRTAHEFVEGDPHAHADRLPESHTEGSAHDHDGSDHDHSHGHDHDHHH